jgi:hypothetical protein
VTSARFSLDLGRKLGYKKEVWARSAFQVTEHEAEGQTFGPSYSYERWASRLSTASTATPAGR